MKATRPVRVRAMTITLASGEAPREWFASCTDADWSDGGSSCNWYGKSRPTESQAKADAARHRRSHGA